MGQAKQRGDFQQRKAEAQVRNAEQAAAREAEFQRIEANLTPEDRARRSRSIRVANHLAMMYGFAAASGVKF